MTIKDNGFYDQIFFRCKDMKFDKAYVLDKEKSEAIRERFEDIKWFCEADFSFNDDFTKIKKKMVDIAKCRNEKCDLRNQCYRFTSEAGYYQSYSNFTANLKDEKGRTYCSFIMIRERLEGGRVVYKKLKDKNEENV